MCVCVCVCMRERIREGMVAAPSPSYVYAHVCAAPFQSPLVAIVVATCGFSVLVLVVALSYYCSAPAGHG